MSRAPLALTYRPRRFAEVVGQPHVTETLRHAVASGRIGSAYLFAGPRGSGKTTTARLLARGVNCTALEEGEPCGSCPSCASILAGRSLDVMEIDAASNRGIEDVRELRERVGYAAVQGEKKIYVVDEVHMLSKDAFNALLKTIEEPPPHVVFVFATTDPQKVLPTVLSRCQRFDFRRIAFRDIEARIREICALEGQAITPEAAFLLARKADGSLRDALGMLDQALSAGGEAARELDAQTVREVLGLAGLDLYLAATDAVRRRDPAAAIRFVRGLVDEGVDLLDFYGELYEHLRNLTLFALPGGEEAAAVPEDFRVAYRETAADIGLEDLLRATAILTEYEFAFKGTAHPEYMLEFLLVRLALLDRTADVASLLDEVRSDVGGKAAPSEREASVPGAGAHALEQHAASPRAPRSAPPLEPSARAPQRRPPAAGSRTPHAASHVTPPRLGAEAALGELPAAVTPAVGPPARPSEEEPAEPFASTVAADVAPRTEVERAWDSVVEGVSQRRASLGSMLAGLGSPAVSGDELVLSVPGSQRFVAEALQDQKNRRLVEEVLASVWSGPRRLRLDVGVAGTEEGTGDRFRRLDRDDPLVRRALDVFDADFV